MSFDTQNYMLTKGNLEYYAEIFHKNVPFYQNHEITTEVNVKI